MIKEIDPGQAWEILQHNPDAVLLDVRSRMEYEYVGHPIGAVNVPWKEFPHWQLDPLFVDKVRTALDGARLTTGRPEDLTVLSLCRSGSRSRSAGEMLLQNGFKDVYNIAEGFEGDKDAQHHRNTINGWRVRGLPWEQS